MEDISEGANIHVFMFTYHKLKQSISKEINGAESRTQMYNIFPLTYQSFIAPWLQLYLFDVFTLVQSRYFQSNKVSKLVPCLTFSWLDGF